MYNILNEYGGLAHGYLCVAALVLFILFAYYLCVYEYKEDLDGKWEELFSRELKKEDVDKLTHDDSTWYYDGTSTCVGYGDWKDECPRHENYCAGGKLVGDAKQQVYGVIEALKNKGVHKLCPLIYK
jgi:hypothetical protein